MITKAELSFLDFVGQSEHHVIIRPDSVFEGDDFRHYIATSAISEPAPNTREYVRQLWTVEELATVLMVDKAKLLEFAASVGAKVAK